MKYSGPHTAVRFFLSELTCDLRVRLFYDTLLTMMEEKNSNSGGFARFLFVLFGSLILGVLLFAAVIIAYENSFSGRIYRGVSVDTVAVGGLTPAEAAEKLERELRYPFESSFTFKYEGREWQATPQQLGFHPQTADMTDAA